jgi:thiol-disulfide isomerase/thioredoxin
MSAKKLIFAVVVLFEIGVVTNYSFAQEPEIKTLEIGSKAPDFNLKGIDDKIYSLADFKQYPILVVIFTCNHCPTAQAYEDKMINYVNTYRPKGVGFVAIMPNSLKSLSLSELGYTEMGDDFDEMKIRAADKKYNFPYLYDGGDEKISMEYGPIATPHVFIFDQDRILKYTGRIDDTENPYIRPGTTDMKNALDAMLAGQPVPVSKTKTFGCSIKWAWKDHWKNEEIKNWANEPVDLDSADVDEIKTLIQNNSDKLRLINLWATWCGPCVMEFPELININRMYRGRDFELVTISADKISKSDKVLEFLKKNSASSDNYIFTEDNKYKLIEAVDKDWQGSLPYTLLVAPGGKIIYKVPEAIEDPLLLKKKIVEYLGRYYADDK